jgi:hypothetical protein
MTKDRIALAAAAGVFTTAIVGGAALATFQPFASDQQTVPATDAAALDKGPIDHLKAVLDPLVTKGTITQPQEDAILQAWKDAAPPARPGKPGVPGAIGAHGFVGDVLKASSDYLGIPVNDLVAKLKAGSSLADVATATSGKSRPGLIDALTRAATVRIDAAVQNNKLTADQAAKIKSRLPAEIGRLVDHKGGTRPGHPGVGPHAPLPTPSPKS